jgi:hypothetical protein
MPRVTLNADETWELIFIGLKAKYGDEYDGWSIGSLCSCSYGLSLQPKEYKSKTTCATCIPAEPSIETVTNGKRQISEIVGELKEAVDAAQS